MIDHVDSDIRSVMLVLVKSNECQNYISSVLFLENINREYE